MIGFIWGIIMSSWFFIWGIATSSWFLGIVLVLAIPSLIVDIFDKNLRNKKRKITIQIVLWGFVLISFLISIGVIK